MLLQRKRSMPSHSDLPGTIKRKKLIKALKRFDFSIDKSGGEGSHYKISCPGTNKIITIPKRIDKDVLYYLIKDIEKYSNVKWEDIQNKL